MRFSCFLVGCVNGGYVELVSDDQAQHLFLHYPWPSIDEKNELRVTASSISGTSTAETVPEWVFPERKIKLIHPPMFSNSKTTVYGIKGYPEWVLKYHTYCRTLESPVDDNLRESFFLQMISSQFPEITNQYKYMSAPAEGENLCPDQFTNAATRFIISSRVSDDLFSVISKHGKLQFPVAIDFAIQLFGMLEKLHSMHIVHGDLHSGNVALKPNTNGREILLIDFGRAVVVPTNRTTIPVNVEVLCDGQMSPWESQGATEPFHLSYRDDAFRALLLTGLMMYGRDLNDSQMRVCSPEGDLEANKQFIHFKEHINFFDTDKYGFHLMSVLPSQLYLRRQQIKDLLMEMLTHVRGLAYGEMPDYGMIIQNLQRVTNAQKLAALVRNDADSNKSNRENIAPANGITKTVTKHASNSAIRGRKPPNSALANKQPVVRK